MWCLHVCLPYILVRFTSSLILPLPLPPFSEQFQQVSFFYFHLWIQSTSTILTLSPLSLCPHTSDWSPPPEKIYFSLLPFIFLKACVDSTRGIRLGTSALYILCFNQVNPPLLTHSLSPSPLKFNSFLYNAFCYVHVQMGGFNIFHSLTFSFLLPPPVVP
jgi:hypothetical protein